MKLTNAILVFVLTSGTVWAQNGPAIIQGAKATANAAQQKQDVHAKAVSAATVPQAAKPVVKPVTSQTSKTVAAKPAIVPVSQAPAAKPTVQPMKTIVSKPTATSSKSPMTPPAVRAKASAEKPIAKPAVKPVAGKPVVVKAAPTAPVVKKTPNKEAKAKAATSTASAKESSGENVSVEKAPEPAKNDRTKIISANGRRDPFISPVVSQSAVGSGCSTGKRCLAVDQISLKGVVKSETGMIAVVVNAVDKAYFLRENDPVFDGYVLKITGDSIVFKETVQDKLGKPFTREVTKKISTPAV